MIVQIYEIPRRSIRNIANRITDYAERHHIPEKDIPQDRIDRITFEWARDETCATTLESRKLARRYAIKMVSDDKFRRASLTC